MEQNNNTIQEKQEKSNTCVKNYYMGTVIFGIIACFFSFMLGTQYPYLFSGEKISTEQSISQNTEKSQSLSQQQGKQANQGTNQTEKKNIKVVIITDNRCEECMNSLLIDSIKQISFLQGASFETLEYTKDKAAKKYLEEHDVKTLPAVLVNTKDVGDAMFESFLKETPKKWYFLEIGATFDPKKNAHIKELSCTNGKDEDKNGATDCKDSVCSEKGICKAMETKVDRPVADLYIMSYCPYGMQAQKAYLEVMKKLGKDADINIKFVHYIMHGKKEAEENIVQYCIQKNERSKLVDYLLCFLEKERSSNEECLKKAKIDTKKLETCIKETKEEYQVDQKLSQVSSQNAYPDFDIHKEEALRAGVQGSPTFVLNGILIEDAQRNAEWYAKAICSTFKNPPKACKESFQNVTFDPMFGFTTGNGAQSADAGCGQ